MDHLKELTIVTPNQPGKLAKALGSLAKSEVNIKALDSSSGYDLNMVRIVATETNKAKVALEKLGYAVTETNVLGVTVPDKPGQLARISALFAKCGVNIDYMYASAPDGCEKALVIFHLSDIPGAERALRTAGFE